MCLSAKLLYSSQQDRFINQLHIHVIAIGTCADKGVGGAVASSLVRSFLDRVI